MQCSSTHSAGHDSSRKQCSSNTAVRQSCSVWLGPKLVHCWPSALNRTHAYTLPHSLQAGRSRSTPEHPDTRQQLDELSKFNCNTDSETAQLGAITTGNSIALVLLRRAPFTYSEPPARNPHRPTIAPPLARRLAPKPICRGPIFSSTQSPAMGAELRSAGSVGRLARVLRIVAGDLGGVARYSGHGRLLALPGGARYVSAHVVGA